jgi:cytochrome c6
MSLRKADRCAAETSRPLITVAVSAAVLLCTLFWQSPLQAAVKNMGEAEFKEHCAACHADGGNIVNPAKTLSRKDRENNGVKTARDIVKIMRKPGAGMTAFDKSIIPDAEAKAIANYIIKTFK